MLIQFLADYVSIARELILDLRAGIGENGERCWISKMASVRAKEFVDFSTRESYVIVTDVHRINDQENLDRSVAAAERLERREGPRSLVIGSG